MTSYELMNELLHTQEDNRAVQQLTLECDSPVVRPLSEEANLNPTPTSSASAMESSSASQQVILGGVIGKR